MTRVVVLDTETTGIDPEKNGIVELGCAAYDVDDATCVMSDLVGSYQSLVDPGHHVPPDASAIHHLTDEDVSGRPSRSHVVDDMLDRLWVNGTVWAAHSAKFDKSMLPELNSGAWVCTYKCSATLLVDQDRHGLQYLRYSLGLRPDPAISGDVAAHRAMMDVACCAELLRLLLTRASLTQLLEISSKPVLLNKVRFGKHAEQLWRDVPQDYLRWIINTGNFDEDVTYTAKYYYRLRGTRA